MHKYTNTQIHKIQKYIIFFKYTNTHYIGCCPEQKFKVSDNMTDN